MSPELRALEVARPCSQKWSTMAGTDRVRFCNKCQLKVYDFARLTTDEVRALLRAHEGRRLCARFFQRRDGRVMTRDCPRPEEEALLYSFINAGGIVTVILLVLVSLLTLFGDLIRRQFGTATIGALSGDEQITRDPAATAATLTNKTMQNFGRNDPY